MHQCDKKKVNHTYTGHKFHEHLDPITLSVLVMCPILECCTYASTIYGRHKVSILIWLFFSLCFLSVAKLFLNKKYEQCIWGTDVICYKNRQSWVSLEFKKEKRRRHFFLLNLQKTFKIFHFEQQTAQFFFNDNFIFNIINLEEKTY